MSIDLFTTLAIAVSLLVYLGLGLLFYALAWAATRGDAMTTQGDTP
ncbi:hypothetical protein GT347_05010 [Xylophilus rhododendri]|uniref:Uncharacterized protein n=1 Tax=Xylophilus rhododendri TaxID=2697032 RepID=A0A857J2Q0_9BURK|nr:hypothetical protein [Xylophilus rhododendri]QHI97399.1 hypothetical protein GT347_05010 [Xylophilus rhododendri]